MSDKPLAGKLNVKFEGIDSVGRGSFRVSGGLDQFPLYGELAPIFAQAPDLLHSQERLLEALRAMIESAVNDSDCCIYCLADICTHSAGCPVICAEAAIASVEQKG